MTASTPGFIRSLAHWFRHTYLRKFMVYPVVVASVVYACGSFGAMAVDDKARFKTAMEYLHPAALALMGILALVWWISTHDPAFGFLAALSLFPFLREVLGGGYDEIAIVGVVGLTFYANRHRRQLRLFLQNPWASSLVATCFLTYLCSQFLDRGIFRGFVRLLLQDESWKIPFSTQMEEALETAGGVLLALTPVAVRSGLAHARGSDHAMTMTDPQ